MADGLKLILRYLTTNTVKFHRIPKRSWIIGSKVNNKVTELNLKTIIPSIILKYLTVVSNRNGNLIINNSLKYSR